jgi:hypothetical protein
MEAFVATEEEAARILEELASRQPERRDEYRRTAEQARTRSRQSPRGVAHVHRLTCVLAYQASSAARLAHLICDVL